MKKLFFFLTFLTFSIQAQYKIAGNLVPSEGYDTAILYKIVGAKQQYINNTKINNGRFYFDFKKDQRPGVYRINYDSKNNGYLDFLFNKEDVIFSFNPKDPENTKTFSQSKENQMYSKFINAITYVQYDVDSLQIAYLKNPSTKTAELYKKAAENIRNVQNGFIENSNGMLAQNFIIATDRFNRKTVAKNANEYLSGLRDHFFDNIDFKNKVLYNSAFLVDRISDYVFYMNYAEDNLEQIKLHKKAATEIINKIENIEFKNDVIKFLINQFKQLENIILVDYLFEKHFNILPKTEANKKFKTGIIAEMTTAIGRTAPNFSWEENGKIIDLKSLNDGKNYILVFYSTTCPHCTDELPKLYEFLKDKPSTSVVAFAMEENDFFYKNFTNNLKGWHHVLGLNKWENKIARTYNVMATPTYFVLNKDKKIIAKPDFFKNIKEMFE